MRTILLAFLSTCLLSGFALKDQSYRVSPAHPDPNPPLQVAFEPAFPSLQFERPLAVSPAPGDTSHLYVASQTGIIYAFDARSRVRSRNAEIFLDLRDRTRANGEQGLLGLAFDPEYAQNGHVYVYYSANSGLADDVPADSVVARFTADPRTRTIRGSRGKVLLRFAQPFLNHNGGALAFGPDGKLYIGSGDGGSGNDPLGNAQNLGVLLGKILRINKDGTIPRDNPFARPFNRYVNARPEIWAYGMRNPFRISFDTETGVLWVGDVGQFAQEEIDHISREGNYGWPLFEGTRCNTQANGETCDSNPSPPQHFVPPVLTYPRSQGRSITGGLVYHGDALPALKGKYVYGDFASGKIWALSALDGAAVENLELPRVGFPSSFGVDLQGELLVTSFFEGRLYRAVPADDSHEPNIPAKLSATGLFTDVSSLTVAPGVIEVAPIAPFWTDGSSKQRWFKLPDGEQIIFHPTEAWTFPQGSKLIKHFEINLANGSSKRMETRVFERRETDWLGYAYLWNDAGSDADLLSGGATVLVENVADGMGGSRSQNYVVPDRNQCLGCHNPSAGFALGIRTAQVNHVQNGVNQLSRFNDLGLLDQDIGDPNQYLSLADPFDSSAPLAERARAYLDSNCASCHLPAGPTALSIDLRAQTPIDQTETIGVPPSGSHFGIPGARRITAGDKTRSLVWTRMGGHFEPERMPPFGSAEVDDAGLDLIGEWIELGAGD